MGRSTIFVVLIAAVLFWSPQLWGANLQSVRRQWAELQKLESSVVAPALHKRAETAMTAVETTASSGSSARLQERVDTAQKRLDELEEAVSAARTLWAHALKQRERALAAGADSASASWKRAENILGAAARKLEVGRREAAERQASPLPALYDQAFREAQQHVLIGQTRKLLRQAESNEAMLYTPRSYVRALDAVQRAEQLLASRPGGVDTETQEAAARAARESEHTNYLLGHLRATCEEANRARMESVVLEWETELERVLQVLGVSAGFEKGMGEPLQRAQVESERLVRERNRLRLDVAQRSDQVDSLQRVIAELRLNVRDFEGMVAELKPFREEANTVAAVQALFTPGEGKVVVDNRDLVLRLHGVRFAKGKAEIPAESAHILQKVTEAVRAFPGAKIVVEGHTDSQGREEANMRLSEDRARAVRQYLIDTTGLDARSIVAVGIGARRPVATNETEDGRALNRRIEIIITRPS